VQGQQQTTLAKLHVNGLQTVTGLFCVAILFACVLYGTQMRDGPIPRRNRYIIVGDALDLMCLMRGSSLPGLIAKPKKDASTSDMRREKAEGIDIAFYNSKLDAQDVKKPFPEGFASPEGDRDHNDTIAATERALARLPYIERSRIHPLRALPSFTISLIIIGLALVFLCCLHAILVALWARHTLNHRYFDLSKLNVASQVIAISSQVCTVGSLALLSYGLQRMSVDKFIRQDRPRSSRHSSVFIGHCWCLSYALG